jgi:hypothetical protein
LETPQHSAACEGLVPGEQVAWSWGST